MIWLSVSEWLVKISLLGVRLSNQVKTSGSTLKLKSNRGRNNKLKIIKKGC
jgi:hypothetical protein